MSGINWISYNSGNALDAGYAGLNGLYNNAITFFNSSPTTLASGTLTSLQVNSGSFGNDTPSFSTFSLGTTSNIAIQFSGYFSPNQTGNWTIHLGPGETTPCDDFAILFLGEPNTTITPETVFTSETNVPSNTLPFIRNMYNTQGGNSKTVNLQAGNKYPILIYYNQGRYGYNFGLGFSYNGGNLITNFASITTTQNTPSNNDNNNINIACFKEGTKVLTDKGYCCVEKLKKGDLVKTITNYYIPIYKIGKTNILHVATPEKIKDQLYVCSKTQYPEINEDVIITGCHCILVDNFKNDKEKEDVMQINGDIYITDNKFRLPACVDDRTSVYDIPGNYNIYHIALENDDYYMNYGIYANGLMVETCSKRYLMEFSNMDLY